MEKTIYRNEKAIATVRCVLTVRETGRKEKEMLCSWDDVYQVARSTAKQLRKRTDMGNKFLN